MVVFLNMGFFAYEFEIILKKQTKTPLILTWHLLPGLTRVTEHELSWGIDTEVMVPSGQQTTAELVIKEEDYNSKFSMLATFRGHVSLNIYSPKL